MTQNVRDGVGDPFRVIRRRSPRDGWNDPGRLWRAAEAAGAGRDEQGDEQGDEQRTACAHEGGVEPDGRRSYTKTAG
jgi:hypothetical protein